MCDFASLVLTKDHVYIGTTDSHEQIIKEHNLHEGAGRVNFVRVEITPEDSTGDKVENWFYWVDQDEVPKWYDAEHDEKRARAALVACGLVTLYADYKAKLATLYADYEAKLAPLDADYEAKRVTLDADYKAKRAVIAAREW